MTYRHILLAGALALGALLIRLAGLFLPLGPLTLVAGLLLPAIPMGILIYLYFLTTPTTMRWRLRYDITSTTTDEELAYLEQGLHFLVKSARLVTLEAQPAGLYLEVPRAFRSYTEKLIPEICPQGRLVPVLTVQHELPKESNGPIFETINTTTWGDRWPFIAQFEFLAQHPLPAFLQAPPSPPSLIEQHATHRYIYHPPRDANNPLDVATMHWGLDRAHDGVVRVQLVPHPQGGGVITAAYAAATAPENVPPGPWRQVPPQLPAPLATHPIIHSWPIGIPHPTSLHELLPRVTAPSVYSAASELLHLPVPPDYQCPRGHRVLGTHPRHPDTPLGLPENHPLLTLNAPLTFLQQQLARDIRHGYGTILITPHRSLANLLHEHLIHQHLPVATLDQANAQAGAHLPLLTLDELSRPYGAPGLALAAQLEFFTEYGIAAGHALYNFTKYMLIAGVLMADADRRDFSYINFLASVWGVNKASHALRTKAELWQTGSPHFRGGLPYLQQLTAALDTAATRHRLLSFTNALRPILEPLWRVPTLHHIVSGPFASLLQVLLAGGLVTCVLDNRDYPENDRLLRGLFEATMLPKVRSLTKPCAVHLHSPARYATPTSLQRWLDLEQEGRVHLLIDTQPGEWYSPDEREFIPNTTYIPLLERIPAQALFTCPETLAYYLNQHAAQWHVSTLTELTELPPGTALARLPLSTAEYFTTVVQIPQ